MAPIAPGERVWHLAVPCPAAGGITAINAIGNISGYVAPQTVGVLRDTTVGYEVPPERWALLADEFVT
jgi:hypothetical protein